MLDIPITMMSSCRYSRYDEELSYVSHFIIIIVRFRTRPTQMFKHMLQRSSSRTSTSKLSGIG